MGILSFATGGMSTVYKWAAIGGAVLVLIVIAFFYGKHLGTQAGDLKIADLTAKYETQLSDLLGIQSITNTKIVIEVVTKTVTIHDNKGKGDVAAENDVDDKNIVLSPKWTCIHNAAVDGSDPTLCDSLPSTGGIK